MRSIGLLVLALVFTGCATGPKMATEERKVSYIDEVKGIKSELYTRASVWFAKTFNDSKSVLEVQDKEAGRLVGKGISDCDPINTTGGIRYTLDVAVKDGKSRMLVEGITMLKKDYDTGILVELGPTDFMFQHISSQEHLDKIKAKCLDPLHKSLVEALDGKKVAPADDF